MFDTLDMCSLKLQGSKHDGHLQLLHCHRSIDIDIAPDQPVPPAHCVLPVPIPWPWDYYQLSKKCCWKFIANNIHKSWCFSLLSDRCNEEEFDSLLVKKYPDKSWNYYVLSSDYEILENLFYVNHDLMLQIIIENIDKCWNFDSLSKIACIYELDLLKIVKENPDKPWDYDELSEYIYLSDIEGNLDKPWNYNILSSNNLYDNIWKIIKENPDKPWDYGELS